jgi:ppGpp synthetase/RelA/SpoT-type nucleotidyltranferase
VRLPLTKSQIEKLGARLVSGPTVDVEDLTQLHGLLSAYGETLRETTKRVHDELDLSPTARVKNTGTIIEKLERYGGSWLKSIQDIAGMRIVGDFDRAAQDVHVSQLVEVFKDETRAPKIVDRRADPVRGYRAVHLIVFPDGIPVEIQVRTRRQHEWAELFEKLADLIGRGIRYGEPPAHWLPVEERASHSEELKALYTVSYDLRVSSVERAVAVAGLIAAVEEAEREAAGAPELVEYQKRADAAVARLRIAIDELRRTTITDEADGLAQ